MNSYQQQLNLAAQTMEYNQQTVNGQKRLRDEDQETQEDIINMQKRPAKTLFRPWCDEQTNAKVVISPNNDTLSNVSNQSQFALVSVANPVIPTPYQLAVQQHQTALAMQQAMYHRQLLMTQVWAQQRFQQHQQMMFHYQQQLRQQMFVFGHLQQQQQQQQQGYE